MKKDKIVIHFRFTKIIIEEVFSFIMLLFFVSGIFFIHDLAYIILFLILISILSVQMVWAFIIFSQHKIELTTKEFTATYFITKSRPKLKFLKSIYYPYTITKTPSYQILETFTLKYDEIKEYGYIFELKGYFKYAKKGDIGFITQQDKRFHINCNDYRRKDLIEFINIIYKKTKIYPTGYLKDVLNKN